MAFALMATLPVFSDAPHQFVRANFRQLRAQGLYFTHSVAASAPHGPGA
jgi:hypothetical protein